MPVFSANPRYTWSVLSRLRLDQRLADTFLCTATSPQALPPTLTSSDKLDFLQDAKKEISQRVLQVFPELPAHTWSSGSLEHLRHSHQYTFISCVNLPFYLFWHA